ncbi:MAG: hypothetical protein AAFN92_16880 [Bacteroidota bacterium]
MSKLLKIALPFLLVGGLLAYQFLQPSGPLDIHAAETEVTVNASGLYTSFETDETAANAAYVGKVIEVSGQLNAIEQDADGAYQLLLAADNPLGQVVCTLADGTAAGLADATIGTTATVKGVCTGYLFDVVVDNATLLSQ